jgi:hypothetical protein
LEAISAALTPLQPPPSLANTEPLDDLVEATESYSHAEATQAGLSAALAALPQPPVMADVAAAETRVNDVSAIVRTQNVNGGLGDVYDGLLWRAVEQGSQRPQLTLLRPLGRPMRAYGE